MIVRILFFFATEDRVFNNATNVVQKGDLISVWVSEKQTAYKFPIHNIMEIQEIHEENIYDVEAQEFPDGFPKDWVKFKDTSGGIYGGRMLDKTEDINGNNETS